MAEQIMPGVSIAQPYAYRGDEAWCIVLRWSGKRKVIRVGLRGEARERAAGVSFSSGFGMTEETFPPPPVAQLLDIYLEWARPRCKKRTLDTYASTAHHLKASLGVTPAHELTEDQLFAYFSGKMEALSYDTVRLHKDLLTSAVKHYWEKYQPKEHHPLHAIKTAMRDAVRVMGRGRGSRQAYTAIEVAGLIRVAVETEHHEVACLFKVAAQTGMRLGEVLGMEWSGVDWEGRSYIPVVSRGRTGDTPLKQLRQRPVLLPPTVIHLLRQRDLFGEKSLFTHDRQFFDTAIVRVRRRAHKKYGVPLTKTFHCLRHFFASEARVAGWSDLELQLQLGHTRVDTTRDYFHPVSRHMKWGFLDDTIPPEEDTHHGIRE